MREAFLIGVLFGVGIVVVGHALHTPIIFTAAMICVVVIGNLVIAK